MVENLDGGRTLMMENLGDREVKLMKKDPGGQIHFSYSQNMLLFGVTNPLEAELRVILDAAAQRLCTYPKEWAAITPHVVSQFPSDSALSAPQRSPTMPHIQ